MQMLLFAVIEQIYLFNFYQESKVAKGFYPFEYAKKIYLSGLHAKHNKGFT